MLVKLSWRNVWRNKVRSMIIMLAIAIGVWAGLFLIAFSWGMSEQRIREAIENETCHIQLHHPKYKDDENIRFFIKNADEIAEQLGSMKGIKMLTTHLNTTGLIASSRNAAGVKFNGINPEEEDNIIGLSKRVVEGKYFEGAKRNPLLISQKLAEKLQVHLRNKVVLTFTTQGDETVTAGFKITGLYKTNNAPYDQMNIFIRKSDLQRLAGKEGMINEIAIKIADAEQSKKTAAKLQSRFPQLLAEYWGDLSPELKLVAESFDQAMQIFITIILLALAFGIINTMLMAVLERVREIGMLMAVGMNKTRIFFMIMLETVMLALTGGPVGLLLTWITIRWTGSSGIDLSNISEGLATFGYTTIIYPALKPETYPQMALEVAALAIIASLYPAWKAIRLNPVEAIRKI